MKKIFILSLMVIVTLSFSQTSPKLYFTITSHNEMTNTEPYDTAPTYSFYTQTRDTLKKIVDMIDTKKAKYNLQTCQKFVFGCLHKEMAATTNTDILQYAYELGGPPYGRVVEIDPRYKITSLTMYTLNIADVAHIIDSTGAKSSRNLGGFVYYNSTVTATASYSVGDWVPYTVPISGTFGQPPWQAAILWGAGSNPPHTHDANNYGTWKPRGKADSIDFYCHDPSAPVWVQGNGCSFVLTPTTNVNATIAQIRAEATKIKNGTYPANKFYNGHIMIDFKDFNNTSYPTFQMRKQLGIIIDSVNYMVTQGKIVWATISQKQDTFNLWSATNSIPYSQWGCGQTTTLAPTCNLASVNELEKENGVLKIYPNPASDELSYEFETFTTKNNFIFIYDNIGREVLRKQVMERSGKISLTNLPAGIYMINASSTRPKKIVIVK